MSLQSIKAGSAFVEVSIRDKTAAGLAAAEARLKGFSQAVRSFAIPMKQLGIAFGALGAGILGPLAAAANTFMTLGKAMGNTEAIKLVNTWKELQNIFKTVAFVTGEALAPALQTMGKVLATAGVAVVRFIQTHPLLIQGLLAVGIVAVLASAALIGLATSMLVVSAVFSIFAGTMAGATVLIGAAVAAVLVLAGTAFVVANNWETTKAIVVTAFEAMAIAANAASQSILKSMQKAFEFTGLGRLAAIAGVAAGVMKQAEGGLSGGLLGKGAAGAAQFRAIGKAAEGFGVSVAKSGSAVGRVGPSSIQKVNDTLTHERLKEILEELKKEKPAGAAKFE